MTIAACGGSAGDSPTPAASTAGTTGGATLAETPVDLAAEARAEVAAAQKRYFDAYRAAAANPRDQALVGALRAVYTDQSVSGDTIRDRMAFLAQRGYVVRPGSDSYFVIEDIKIDAFPPHGQAVATMCGYDTDVVIDGVNRAPDGKEIVVSDTRSSVRTRTTWVEQSDGSWKISSGVVVDSWQGENRCPPRPAAS